VIASEQAPEPIIALDEVRDALASAQLSFDFRLENRALWDETFAALPYGPVSISSAMLDYQLAYQKGHGGEWLDISLIIHWDSKPAALWPVCISRHHDKNRISSQGLPVLAPAFIAGLSDKSRKRIVKNCLAFVHSLGARLNIEEWESCDCFPARPALGDWHLESMALGAGCSVRHELFVDLSPPLPEIRAGIRKRFKSLVTAGARLWETGILTKPADHGTWNEFRQLHLQAAGRATRSDESWDIQREAIDSGDAILIYLRDGNGRMVGGGLFYLTPTEGCYAVGAYDRDLFDKPIGHVVQFAAIEEMKNRGMRWYKIGTRFYPSDKPQPTEKELSISYFKEGFASHVFPHFSFLHRPHNSCVPAEE
jgi:FemAB family protein